MATYARNDETVYIKCPRQTAGRFNVSDAIFVSISNLHFVGCGGNTVTRVEQLIIIDTIFQGVKSTNTTLILNEVTNASIATSFFL